MKTPNSSMLKSGDHKDELAKDITYETDKLSVGFDFDIHYTSNWIETWFIWRIWQQNQYVANIYDP